MSFTDWEKSIVAFNSPQIGDIVHWGRSKRDGAPGVGTGNWRRGGRGIFKYLSSDGSFNSKERDKYLKEKTITIDELNKKGRKKVARLLRSRNPQKQEAAYKLLNQLNPDNVKEKSEIEKSLFGKTEKDTGLVKFGFLSAIRKQARSMSNEELKDAISRLQMEKQYSELLKQQNRGILAAGAEVASNVLKRSLEAAGTKLLTGRLTELGNAIKDKNADTKSQDSESKDTSPKQEKKSEPKDTSPKQEKKSEPKDTSPKQEKKSEPKAEDYVSKLLASGYKYGEFSKYDRSDVGKTQTDYNKSVADSGRNYIGELLKKGYRWGRVS